MSNAFFFVFTALFFDFSISWGLEYVVEVMLHPFLLLVTI